MKNLRLLLVLLGMLALCLYLMLRDKSWDGDEVGVLELHCAAGLQKPVEEIARQYEKEYGVKIKLNFGGSGQLFTKLAVAGGDLYLPADVSYIDRAREQDLVTESIPVSHLTAGIMVAKGNPKGIRSLRDLTRDDVRVALAERSAAVGEFSHEVLEESGILAAIESGDVSKRGTVNEVAMQVDLGASDAGIVWDVLLPQYKHTEFIRVLEFNRRQKLAVIGVLKSSQKRSEALHFARYLSGNGSDSRGGEIFRKYGFDVDLGEH